MKEVRKAKEANNQYVYIIFKLSHSKAFGTMEGQKEDSQR